MTCTEEEVQRELKIIIQRVEAGEEVVITRDGEPVARMVGASKKSAKGIPFDSLKDDIEWTEDWEKPMSDQEVFEFFGR